MFASQVTDQLQNYLLPECVPINPKCHDFGLRATARRTARSGQQVGIHPRRRCGSLLVFATAHGSSPCAAAGGGLSNRCCALSLPGRIVTGGPHALDESRDPHTLIAAKTTVFANSTTFDDLDSVVNSLARQGRLILAPAESGCVV